MSAQKTPGVLVTFLGLMGALLILLAVLIALDATPIILLGWFESLLIFQTLALGITEICVAWLIHSHRQ